MMQIHCIPFGKDKLLMIKCSLAWIFFLNTPKCPSDLLPSFNELSFVPQIVRNCHPQMIQMGKGVYEALDVYVTTCHEKSQVDWHSSYSHIPHNLRKIPPQK